MQKGIIKVSKKVAYSKHLKKGKFYVVHDGSKTGHPGEIRWKNDKKNLYLAVVTGTTYDKHKIRLTHPTSRDVSVSYIDKRPFMGKRRDFGDKELIGMKFHEDDKSLIRVIERRNPIYSNSFKRHKKEKNHSIETMIKKNKSMYLLSTRIVV